MINDKITYNQLNNNYLWFGDRDLLDSDDYEKNTINRINNFFPNISEYNEKYILWDCLDEYEPPAFISNELFEKINHYLKKYKKYLIFLLGSPNQEIYKNSRWLNSNINYVNIPTTSLYSTISHGYLSDINDRNFDFFIKCLNNAPHHHRCTMIDYLSKYELVDGNLISWNIINKKYSFKFFNQKQIHIDYRPESSGFANHSFTEIESTSLFEIVNESNSEYLFFSEKTWKSLLDSRTVSFFFGAKNQNTFLNELGFQLYDELIDYKFDNEVNLEDRAEKLILQLKKYENKNKKNIFDLVKEKTEYNRKLCYELYKNQKYIPVFLIEIIRNDYHKLAKNQFLYGQSSHIITSIYNSLNK